MKLHSKLKVNGRIYKKGSEMPARFIYPFFLFHMLMFGLSGFLMAYSSDAPDVTFLYMHGGFAIFVYVIFYLTIFGVDQVKWMFINAGLSIDTVCLATQIHVGLGGLLGHHVHICPALVISTTFQHGQVKWAQAIADLLKTREITTVTRKEQVLLASANSPTRPQGLVTAS